MNAALELLNVSVADVPVRYTHKRYVCVSMCRYVLCVSYTPQYRG